MGFSMQHIGSVCLDQPMMVIVWCHNWEDASKFQYLMQILQVHYGDFVPQLSDLHAR